MRKYGSCILAILMLFALSENQSVIAQNGVIVESVEKTFDQKVFYELYTDNEIWDNPELRKKTFPGTDLNKLEKSANEIGQPPNIEKMKMYVQGEKFRIDSESPSHGKMTAIFRKDLGMMYQIIWEKKTVVQMSIDEAQKMTKGLMDMSKQLQKNMPSMEKMLESLPPEQRQKAIEAMKAAGQMPSSTGKKAKPTIKKTGRKIDINEFPQCEEYSVVQGNKNIVLWATGTKPRLTKMLYEMAKDFKSSFGMADDDDVDPWELIPNKLPVLTVTYEEDMMRGRTQFEVVEILSVKETKIPAKIFEEYKNPELKKGSMMDMMNMETRKR